MIKEILVITLGLLTLGACADQKASIYALQTKQKERQISFERELTQHTNNPKVGQIGPEGDLNLVGDVTFDEILRQSVKGSKGRVHLLNGYATGVLEVKLPPHPFARLAQLAPFPVTEINASGYPITDAYLTDLNKLPVSVLGLASTDVKTLLPLRGNERLQSIHLGSTPINHDAMVTLSQLPNLQNIDISSTQISGQDLLLLKNLGSLSTLVLNNCKNIQKSHVANLIRCSQAKRLNIIYSQNSSSILHQAKKLAEGRHFEDADELLENAIQTYRDANHTDYDLLCQAFTCRAEISLSRGDWKKAKQYAEQALKYSVSAGVEVSSRLDACCELGKIYNDKDRYQEAIDVLQNALKKLPTSIKGSNDDSLATEPQLAVLLELVRAQAGCKKRPQMLETVRKMETLWTHANLPVTIVISEQIAVGRICLQQGEYRTALRVFKSAESECDTDNKQLSFLRRSLKQLIDETSGKIR
jgi:tetratricopeptide (TPR) repeat protein